MIAFSNKNAIDPTIEALTIEKLSVSYQETLALSEVSLSVFEGDYLGIIGPNGGGKTTLLKSIIGLVPPSSGKVSIYGKKIGKNSGVIGYVPQSNSLDTSFPITVHEVVLTGMLTPSFSFFHKYSQEDKKRANEHLEQVGILKLKNRMISELSGGEFQKMLIARALAVHPKILLLDEPTASVDTHSREQIYSLLSALNKEMTIILVTHDLSAVSSQVKSLACLNKELVYHGDTEINEEVVSKMYGCPVDLIAHGLPHRVLSSHKRGE